jgi:drug/metabolite transporter (DMT)-like permease
MYSATIGSAGAYAAYYYSLRTLTASQAAALQYVQPVLSTCFGVFLLGETWGAGFAVGASLILIGIFLAERSAPSIGS